MSISSNQSSSRLSAKGSLIVHTGTGTTELAVGTDGQILSAQSTATAGISWIANTASSVTVGMVQISSTTATASIATVSFTAIPSTYKHLVLYVIGRTDSGSTAATLRININSDSTSAYTRSNSSYNNSGAYQVSGKGDGASLQAWGQIDDAVAGSVDPTSHIGATRIFIPNYAGTSVYKVIKSHWSGQSIATGAYLFSEGLITWRNTSAISSILIQPNPSTLFNSGTIVSLYGLV
jgi:hypothetical protein